ncbi:TIGR03435 family protein [Terriglobus sp. RCC_193]|uniref:TIGR03435 family protein n=1 Tax=Terriglobus sp. RCC_193 TaxID=3239218 RepID=UPI0035253FA6
MFEWMHPVRKLLALTMLVAPISVVAMGQTATSHANTKRPSFEVASVRAHDPGDRRNFNNFQAYPDGRFTSDNSSLWMLIHYAFQLQPYQISGGPDWIRSAGYDLNAKPAEAHDFDDIPLMLQGVLEDCFQLKYHWEMREQPVYNLVVTKPGKLRESVVKTDCPRPFSHPEGIPHDAPCGDLENHTGYTKGYKLSSSEFAASLSWLLSKPVVDMTNLSGHYDVELRWTPESAAIRPDISEQNTPDIFTAIQEQLGLKLQPAKGPVRLLVIDHVEKPSDN